MAPPVSEDAFKAAMGSFGAGVTVVTTADETGVPFGLTATAFSSVSKAPPLCLVCVSLEAEAHPAIVRTRRFAVNVLSAAQEHLSTKFATKGIDKFGGVPWEPGAATGAPLLAGVIATVECIVSSTVRAGDHDVFVGTVESVRIDESGEPLLYFRGLYRALSPL
jgi:flavin reductase (DIM6/NTAB) family NADH-FMN oxidoreductase RutF